MSNQSNTYDALLIFSIGPVQDFIAAARRTQDLWMGSFLLSYLASRALKTMRDTGAEVLYPDLTNQPLLAKPYNTPHHALATLPNKFTVAVGSLQEGQDLAMQAKEAVLDAWGKIHQAVQTKFPPQLRNAEMWDKIWEDQTDNWLEVYWAVTPRSALPAAEQDQYGVLHRLAQQFFEARKGLRDFRPAEELGEKCTVCAKRAALHRERGSRKDQKGYWADVAAAIRNKYPGLYVALDAEGNERLCTICTVKRFAQRFYFEPEWKLKATFPSTSSIATSVFRRDLLEKNQGAASDFAQALDSAAGRDVRSADQSRRIYKPKQSGLPWLKDFEKAARGFVRYDGDLFFEETYTQRKLRRDYGVDFKQSTLSELRGVLSQLLSRAGLGQPPRYYAVLAMDGDRMGIHINSMETAEQQKEVSAALCRFAKDVQRIVENEGGGRVVYAGGDDVLALLPLETALETADKLRLAYERQLGAKFTFSGGIAIAHHQAPLSGVLAAAREAEHASKHLYDRDALCVVALKRSGEALRVGAHWQEKGVSCDMPALVDRLRRYFREADQLSSKFAYEAHAQARELALNNYEPSPNSQPPVRWKSGVPLEALKSVLRRLAVQRHRGDKLPVPKAEKLAEDLAALAQALDIHWRQWIKDWYKHHRRDPQLADAHFAPHPGAEEMGRWLLLARFLERGGEA